MIFQRLWAVSGKGAAQRQPDLVLELAGDEWLADNVPVMPAAQSRTLGKAAHEQYGQSRPSRPDIARELRAAHSRHRKIDDDQVDGGVAVEQLKCCTAAAGFKDVVT